MSKLFTRRGVLIQAMLYAIGRIIFSVVRSEMNTTNTSASGSGATLFIDQSGSAAAGMSDAKQLIDLIDSK